MLSIRLIAAALLVLVLWGGPLLVRRIRRSAFDVISQEDADRIAGGFGDLKSLARLARVPFVIAALIVLAAHGGSHAAALGPSLAVLTLGFGGVLLAVARRLAQLDAPRPFRQRFMLAGLLLYLCHVAATFLLTLIV